MTVAASNYPFLHVMWSIFVFFGVVLWFWLLFSVFGDLFRRDDIGGWGKTGWTVLVILVPLIGAFIYLIVEGRAMTARYGPRPQQRTDEYIDVLG